MTTVAEAGVERSARPESTRSERENKRSSNCQSPSQERPWKEGRAARFYLPPLRTAREICANSELAQGRAHAGRNPTSCRLVSRQRRSVCSDPEGALPAAAAGLTEKE